MTKYVQQAIDAIIRPPRYEYKYRGLPLYLNADDDHVYMRHPLVIENDRNQHIIGSLFHMAEQNPMAGGPCVIYLHGNASAQLEGQFLVPNFCPRNVFVFVYDAIGCGCSDGDYISLGHFEKQDIETLMRFLNEVFNLGPFGLWGRSMGAATSALAHSPLLQCIVCDSAYTSIPGLVSAIAKSLNVPSLFVPAALKFLSYRIEKIANFDLTTVAPLEAVKKAQVPALFGHARADQFVPYEMGEELYANYKCPDKMFVTFEKGGHNSRRNASWIRTAVEFILIRLGLDTYDLEISECRSLQSTDFHFTSFNRLLENKESKGESKRNVALEEPTEPEKEKKKKHHHHHHHKNKDKKSNKNDNNNKNDDDAEEHEISDGGGEDRIEVGFKKEGDEPIDEGEISSSSEEAEKEIVSDPVVDESVEKEKEQQFVDSLFAD